jgi:hypothetical protein
MYSHWNGSYVGHMTVGVTESFDSAYFLNIRPREVHVRPGNTFSKVPVRICNLFFVT